MKTKLLLLGAAIGTAALLGGSFVLPALAGQEPAVVAATDQGWLDIPEVHRRLEAAGYRDIVEIERKRDRYEVKATDREGRRMELDVDPRKGEVVGADERRSEEGFEQGREDRRESRDKERRDERSAPMRGSAN